MLNLRQTIKKLGEREIQARKKGYHGDACEHAFRRHLLILLSSPKKKRKPTEYQEIVGQQLKAGCSLQLAHKAAKEMLEKIGK